MSLTVTALVENTAYGTGLKGEHGLSFYIEKDNTVLLFDTGQTGLFLENAEVLGKDILKAEKVVLSHGHYDHTGGLPALLEKRPDIEIVGHKNAFMPKFSRSQDGEGREIGIPLSQERISSLNVTECSQVTEVAGGVYTITDIPRKNYFEEVGDYFYLNKECTINDTIEDDLSLVIETEKGIVCLLGCAHAGIANILDYIDEKFPGRKIRAVLGGTHLCSASGKRLTLTLDALKKHEIYFFQPGHCTGIKETSFFLMQSFVKTEPLCTGTYFTV